MSVSGIDCYQVVSVYLVGDVSSVACRAAIELDNARRQHEDGHDFRMCHLLVRWLRGVAEDQREGWGKGFSEILWPLYQPDEEAQGRISYPHEIVHDNDLIAAIDHLAAELEWVAKHTERCREDERLITMRDICLQISEQASLVEWDDRHGHRRERLIAA